MLKNLSLSPINLYLCSNMNIWDENIEQYLLDHIEPEPEFLKQLTRKTHLYTLKPRMLSGHLEGRLLKFFCLMANARNVLEIGTFTGYSALCMAEALPPDGRVHTCEINDEMEEFLTQVFADAGELGQRVALHIGDANVTIPSIDAVFDVAFLDGNKRHYLQDLETVYPKMRKGGLIIADNTLWDGHVLEDSPKDAQTLGIDAFNDKVAHDSRFTVVMLPVRDGMTLLRVN
jgi:caffeoyl-CoA O-methyltransferase